MTGTALRQVIYFARNIAGGQQHGVKASPDVTGEDDARALGRGGWGLKWKCAKIVGFFGSRKPKQQKIVRRFSG
jgi:hypothetical protein